VERLQLGDVPPKHHIKFEQNGQLRWEHCITWDGFDGPYTIAYRENGPHRLSAAEPHHGWELPEAALASRPLRRRHYRSGSLQGRGGAAVDARVPMLFNDDVVISMVRPDVPDPVYFKNADGDDLFFVFEGTGTLRTELGDLRYEPLDYVYVPRGILHRFVPDEGVEQTWLSMECLGGMHLLKQWRNALGQLRMDAPYCHRDFKKPEGVAPTDEGIRDILVKRNGFHGFRAPHSPLDVVGYDGTIYPWVFPILNFQPRAGLTHLPPTWHGTFGARRALICSFVPRVVDFHPDAIPCPYPHSAVDMDEFLFYVRGDFTSRRGVGPGSISHHPAGVPHGPHPGAYEASIGTRDTDEMAVMIDTFGALQATAAALGVEDVGYNESFLP